MLLKLFTSWAKEKNILHNKMKHTVFSPRPREIVYAKMGVNIGFEADGKKDFLRPVIVLAKIGSLYWIAPLTSQFKQNPFHYKMESVRFKNVEHSVIMLSQARIVDGKRFLYKIGEVNEKEFLEIQKEMQRLYFPSLS